MNHYLYFMGTGNLAILLSFLTENLFSKFTLLGLGVFWIIAGYFVQKDEIKLSDLKFKIKTLDNDNQYKKFTMITNLLELILKEINDKGGKNGK